MRLSEFEFYPLGAFRPLGGRRGHLRRLFGKDNSTPAPDPKLVDAQVQSLGIQNDAIQRMMSMSEDLAPLQKQQLQQTIDQSAQLWQQNQDDRQFALQKRDQLSGIQDKIANEANTFDQQAERDKLAGQSDSDVAQAFQVTRDANTRALERSGVNPNDGRSAAMNTQSSIQEALARVQGRKLATDTARTEKLQLEDRANNTLAGYPAMTSGEQSQGVNTMGAGMSAINSGVSGLLAPQSSIAGAAGQMGSNATSMYGAQESAYQSAQNADSSVFGALGSGLGSIGTALII